jgi:hypothetical protein
MVRYYGHFSNISRGKRKKNDKDELIPSILEPVEDPTLSGDGSYKEHRRNWARLIQKIYEKARPPPKANAPQPNVHIDYSDSQVPPCEDYLYCDQDYPIEIYAS